MFSRANETHRCILIRVPVAAGDVLNSLQIDLFLQMMVQTPVMSEKYLESKICQFTTQMGLCFFSNQNFCNSKRQKPQQKEIFKSGYAVLLN